MFDPIINKNMLNMKLQQLDRHKNRQQSVLNGLPELQKSIQVAKKDVVIMDEQFKTMATEVLHGRVHNTITFIPQCENKLTAIKNNLNKLKTSSQ